jgi:hypothetical protein
MRIHRPELKFELLNRLPSDFISRPSGGWIYVSPRLHHGGKNFFFVIRVDDVHGEIPPEFPEFFVELLTVTADTESLTENLVNDGEGDRLEIWTGNDFKDLLRAARMAANVFANNPVALAGALEFHEMGDLAERVQ